MSQIVKCNYLKNYQTLRNPWSCLLGYQLQQEYMYSPNYWHHWFPPVPRHAEAVHKQGARVHSRILSVQPTESWGASAHLRSDQGIEGTRFESDTYYVDWKQMWRECRTERGKILKLLILLVYLSVTDLMIVNIKIF